MGVSRKLTVDLGSVTTASESVGASSFDEAFAYAASGACAIEGSADDGGSWHQLPGAVVDTTGFHATLLTPLIRVTATGPVQIDLTLIRST